MYGMWTEGEVAPSIRLELDRSREKMRPGGRWRLREGVEWRVCVVRWPKEGPWHWHCTLMNSEGRWDGWETEASHCLISRVWGVG